jgi:hypothetical protein
MHCRWYTKNLPPGVIEMNNRPQPAPEGIQVSGSVVAGALHPLVERAIVEWGLSTVMLD